MNLRLWCGDKVKLYYPGLVKAGYQVAFSLPDLNSKHGETHLFYTFIL
jgi:hypothetical protein